MAIPDDFRFVDPAVYVAVECYRLLRDMDLLSGTATPGSSMAFLSVANPTLPPECLTSDGQLTRAFKYGRDVGSDAVITKPVPFTRERFGEDVFRNIGRLLPRTAAMLDAKTRTSRIGEDASLGRVKANFLRLARWNKDH